MENKAHALAAGIFVTLLTALVLGMAAWLTRDTGIRDTYEISTRESVTGLQEQAPVRYRGVDVGKVSSVGFDPKVPGNVLLRLEVDREAPMTRDTYATLSFQGVTGLAFVQLADDGKSNVRLVPNDEVPPRIPLRPGLLAKLEERGEVILDQVEQVGRRINTLLSDDNQRRISKALESIDQAAGGANQLVKRLDNTVATRLDPALAEATTTMRGVQRTVDEVGKTATEFRATAREFGATAQRLNGADGPIDRLSEGADSLSAAADQFGRATLPRINRVADETQRTVKSLGRAVNELTENPQALLYGEGPPRPGPGEPGFRAPEGGR
jgi:phospholipid/cholesterol/gamma-HCH transport system substrate-binding protein